MKYLNISLLNFLENDLRLNDLDGRILFSFDAFSCKMIRRDKKEWKNLLDKETYLPLAEPVCFGSRVPIDHHRMEIGFTELFKCTDIDEYRNRQVKPPLLVDRSVRPEAYFVSPKLFCQLLCTLKLLIGDVDDDITSLNFSYESSIQDVINYVDSIVLATAHSYCRDLRGKLWSSFNNAIAFNRCSIFCYVPDPSKQELDGMESLRVLFLFYDHGLRRMYSMCIKHTCAIPHSYSLESLNTYYNDVDV